MKRLTELIYLLLDHLLNLLVHWSWNIWLANQIQIVIGVHFLDYLLLTNNMLLQMFLDDLEWRYFVLDSFVLRRIRNNRLLFGFMWRRKYLNRSLLHPFSLFGRLRLWEWIILAEWYCYWCLLIRFDYSILGERFLMKGGLIFWVLWRGRIYFFGEQLLL